MYPNLFKQFNLPKLCNDISRTGDVVSQIEVYQPQTVDNREQSKDEQEKYPELSVKAFFDFMRTAYQVNETFDELANTLTANSEIDWTALARVSLNSGHSGNSTKLDDSAQLHKSLQTTPEGNDNAAPPLKIDNTPSLDKSQDAVSGRESLEDNRRSEEQISDGRALNKQKCYLLTASCENKKEPLLSKVMKRYLSDVLHEGLLDSVLPHITARPVHSQPVIGRSLVIEPKKTVSAPNGLFENRVGAASNGNRDKDKDRAPQKKCTEAEVEIHVCDEAKNIKKDFRCPQRLLVQKMCYFAEVTAGQKLEEMDISVHCDIVIFDWLMRWVKKDIIKKSEWPVLEPSNVVPIMVSASFLQMDPLLDCCLGYCHANMSDILRTTTVLSCLNDHLLSRLADLFSNAQVEAIKDKKDKIQSRLFCKLIMSLASTKPDHKRGHYGSLATLFKCAKCEKNVIRSISNLVPCVPSNMRIDGKGNLHSKHTRDMSWSLNDYIVDLRSELRSWRRVYWRLWGDSHFLFCRQCGIYFPVNQMDWCSYHPESPQFFINEQQRATPFPLGRYPCCSQRAYRFQAVANRDGCRFKEHVPEILSEKDEHIVNAFLAFRDVVSIEAPQLFFPEKITRLAARDPNLPAGKLAGKEVFWWEGIEMVPPRPKLGLLAKIWGGSSIRKASHNSSHKSTKKLQLQHQVSQRTDVSSVVSSESCSDEDEDASHEDRSTCDDESSESDVSRDWDSVDGLVKKKKKIKTSFLKRCEGMGSWSSSLTVRYNQDNQRDFEEKAAAQMIALLTKRTILEYNLRPKSQSLGKYSHCHNSTQPLGGTYVRLEAEFLNQVAQNNKCKNSVPIRTSTRIKSSK